MFVNSVGRRWDGCKTEIVLRFLSELQGTMFSIRYLCRMYRKLYEFFKLLWILSRTFSRSHTVLFCDNIVNFIPSMTQHIYW